MQWTLADNWQNTSKKMRPSLNYALLKPNNENSKVPRHIRFRAVSQNVECSGEIGAGCIQIDLPRKDFSTFSSPKSMAEFGTFQMYCNLQYIFFRVSPMVAGADRLTNKSSERRVCLVVQ